MDKEQIRLRVLNLVLDGEPQAKQSTTFGRNGAYTKKKFTKKESDYRNQITNQLPKDWQPYENWVQVNRVMFIHEPTKKQLKNKKQRAYLERGGLIPKCTTPDLSDNLPKLLYDSLEYSKKYPLLPFVMSNDSRVQMIKNASKWYGLNPRIEISLIGY
jgi:hypothetical protein